MGTVGGVRSQPTCQEGGIPCSSTTVHTLTVFTASISKAPCDDVVNYSVECAHASAHSDRTRHQPQPRIPGRMSSMVCVYSSVSDPFTDSSRVVYRKMPPFAACGCLAYAEKEFYQNISVDGPAGPTDRSIPRDGTEFSNVSLCRLRQVTARNGSTVLGT